MDDEQPAMHEQYPSVTTGDDPDGTSQDALWPVPPIASSEVGVQGDQSDSRNGMPNGVSTPALDLRPVDLAEQHARSSSWSAHARSSSWSAASYGRVTAGPWRVDGIATASPLAASIVAAVPTALVVLDADLRVSQANPAYYETFKVVPGETERHDFFGLGGGQWDIPWLRASLIRILNRDSRFHEGEVERVFPLLGLRTMRIEARPLVGPDADDLILLAIEDVTERKAAEQQRRDFILVLAHELRNPLTSIMGYAQRMQEHKGNVEEALGIISAQARQLNRIVEDLLDGSSQGTRQLRLEPGQMDLVALARVSTQQAQLLEPLHTIRLELPGGPITGLWDEGRLTQVFANVLGNAIKYSPAGSEIVVRVEDLGSVARVSVQDRGIGITPEELPNLFDRFYRVAATAHRAQGLGIGLHVAKVLVEAHGGSIAVESVLGLGSTFRMTLPLDSLDPRTQ
jgi:two-component system, chemotaxis family, CheB/CheR fusion protein